MKDKRLNEYQNEIWKPIPGFEGLYDISTLGRVRKYPVKNNLKYYLEFGNNGTGYQIVFLYKNCKRYKFYVHRLVMLTFVGECPIGYQIDHIDTDKTNNRLSNLHYVTPKENINNILTIQKRKFQYKPVIVFDKNRNYLDEFESISATARALKIQPGIVSNCAYNDIIYKGYYFKFK